MPSTTPTTPESPRAAENRVRGWRRFVVIVAAIVAALLFLVVLGAFVPAIPGFGLVGSTVSGYATWIGFAAVAATGVAVWGLTRRRTRLRAVFVGITALTLVGAVVMQGRFVSLATDWGVALNPVAGPLAESAPDDVQPYVDPDGSPLDMAVWQPNDDTAAGGAPVVFFVHGGGWVSGSATDQSGDKRWFADRGWLVMSVDYSLSSDTDHEWDRADDQVTCGLIWANEHAADYGGDASRFAVIGDSAGGNLAINAAYQANSGAATPACDGDLPTISAVATAYPAVDAVSFYDNDDLLLGSVSKGVAKYTGGTPDEYPDRYEAVASTTYIDASSPATLVIAAENDHLVPPVGAYDFVDAARAADVDVTLVRVPYAEHVFDSAPQGKQLFLGITAKWLDEHVPAR